MQTCRYYGTIFYKSGLFFKKAGSAANIFAMRNAWRVKATETASSHSTSWKNIHVISHSTILFEMRVIVSRSLSLYFEIMCEIRDRRKLVRALYAPLIVSHLNYVDKSEICSSIIVSKITLVSSRFCESDRSSLKTNWTCTFNDSNL